MSSSSRRRDPGRKQTRAVDPHVDSGEDELLQPRARHHAKKSQKQPTSIIKGDVHINGVKGNVYLVQGSRDDERPQRSSTPTRNPPRHQQSARTTKRLTTQCDPSSTSEEDATSPSGDTEPEDVAPRQPRIPMAPPVRPRKHSGKKKRDQADEGYHTSGTVSYTAQVSGKIQGKGKGKERSASPVASSSTRPRRDSKMSKETVDEEDASSSHSDADDGDEGSAEGDEETEQTAPQGEDEASASDDDFLKLPIHIGNPNNQDASPVLEQAILDTGTKVDWISQNFYDDLRDMGVRTSKLSAQELEVQYRDFNGKKFHPTGKVNLMIQTDEFKGDLKCRTMRFFVANKATFSILFGRDTIRKHGFYTRGNRDTAGEGVNLGVLEGLSEAQKAEQKRKKDEQNKRKAEKKAGRDTKNEKTAKQKENASLPSSSDVSAHLATTVPRSSKCRSPPGEPARRSTSSLEGTW